MFDNPQLFLFFATLSTVTYWMLPATNPKARAVALIAFSCVAIFIASPLALVLCAACTLIVLFTTLAMRRVDRARAMWVGVIAIVITVVLVETVLAERTLLTTIGLSYVALKSISVIVDHWDSGPRAEQPGLLQTFLLNSFFPIFSAGPIERFATFEDSVLAARFQIRDLIEGVARIVLGIFKTSFLFTILLAPYVASRYGSILEQPEAFSRADFLSYTLLNFLCLYVNFSGYTDIAVGTGRLFSLRIMENFRFPYLATNIQDFWQRWHLSLGNFVNRYVFMTFARMTKGQIEISLVLSFVLVGLWHELSLPYLIWGLMHGTALAAVARLNQVGSRNARVRAVRLNPAYRLAARVLTVFFASYVYSFASSGSVVAGFTLTMGLMGV